MSSAAVREGETVSLTCNSTCPVNNATYTWFQNREPLTKHTSRDLILDPVKSDDSGTYSCAVEGNEKHPSPEVNLSVQFQGLISLSRLVCSLLLISEYLLLTVILVVKCCRAKDHPRKDDKEDKRECCAVDAVVEA
ncbi:B-cell receptor CD22-like [Sardina pilchardus]|uniref:B-cell receptor CD22-like n=1 Tax=Sardina pilchardus TaxID=27697 RepID=UPI002E0FE3C9